VFDEVAEVLRRDRRIQYALVFGSFARGTNHAGSDLDVAIGGLTEPMDALALGDLISRLESATRRTVDLVSLDEAPPGLAYRVFRDGIVILERDSKIMAARKARAILDYLDWKPVEDLFAGTHSPETGRGR